MQTATLTTGTSKSKKWTRYIISIVAVLFLLFDVFGKLTKPEPVIEATTALGYPETLITPIGIILLICTVLYMIPRTSILGAFLLTGYLGGAVASNLRVGRPLFSDTLFPVYFAILIWIGLSLRNDRVPTIFSFKNQ